MIIEQEKRLKLAVQKNGRLSDKSLGLLRKCGLNFEDPNGNEVLFSQVDNFPLDLYFDREDDIPFNVASGTVDFGIAGRNKVIESGVKVREIAQLGFARCRLVIAAPENIETVEQLNGGRIVTSYPNSTSKYLRDNKVTASIEERRGSIETYVQRGFDAIVDLSSSGRSLRRYGLKPLDTLFESEAVVITRDEIMEDPGSSAIVEELLFRVDAVQNGERYRYILMNVPASLVDTMAEISHGLRAPTLQQLHDPDWMAMSMVVKADQVWSFAKLFKESGATGIIVQRIEAMIF